VSRGSATVISALVLTAVACAPVSGGEAGGLNGTGSVPISFDAKGRDVTISLSGRLDRGGAKLTVTTPDALSLEMINVDGPADLSRTIRSSATPGTWRAVWTLEDADGRYELTWSWH
jgi:hypothetical protein